MTLEKILNSLMEMVLKLPESPVQEWLTSNSGMDSTLLGVINYFVPFELAYTILTSWCALMVGVYVYLLAMKLFKK